VGEAYETDRVYSWVSKADPRNKPLSFERKIPMIDDAKFRELMIMRANDRVCDSMVKAGFTAAQLNALHEMYNLIIEVARMIMKEEKLPVRGL
jgi:hypothetical protein